MSEKKYILKIGETYVSGKEVKWGLPMRSNELENAKIFTYDEALSIMSMICLEAQMIEV